MSEQEILPAVAAAPRRAYSRVRRFFLRHLPLGAGTMALVVIAAGAGLFAWMSSAGFEDLVRRQLIRNIETATGGRAEIHSFGWKLIALEAEASGVVIHGREKQGEAPYASIERLRVKFSILGIFNPRLSLRDVAFYRPGFHLIVYPDGSTNQPQPRRSRKPGRPVLDTLFDLKAAHVGVQEGEIDIENRSDRIDFQNRHLPLDFDAAEVSLRIAYSEMRGSSPALYRIEGGASHLNIFRGDGKKLAQTAQGRVDFTLDLSRREANLTSMRVSADGHDLFLSGAMHDFAHPRWEAKASGELDMRIVDPITGYPDAPAGVAHLDIGGAGQGGQFRVDGTARVEHGSYVGVSLHAIDFDLETRLHADPNQLLIAPIVLHLRHGGQIEGTVKLTRWLETLPGTPVLRQSNSRPAPLRADAIGTPVNGKVTSNFENVPLDGLLEIVSPKSFQRLGIDARLNGPASATWEDGDNHTLAIGATFTLSAPQQTRPGEVAATGEIDGTYTHRDGVVDLRTFDLRMPSSQLQAHGHLGANPVTSPTSLAVDLSSHDLREFDTVLRDLGLARFGRQGTAALPVDLAGELQFHGSWAGALVDPHISGTVHASNFAVEMPSKLGDNSGNHQMVRFDSADGTGSYAATHIEISQGRIAHGGGTINLSGALSSATPAPLGTPSFDENSQLRLHVRANKIGTGEVLQYTGLDVPVTGVIDAQLDASGQIHSLGGTGWVELDKGTVYGEPVSRIRVQGSASNQILKLTSATLNDEGGKVQLTGGYDFHTGQFQIDSQTAGFDLSRFQFLRRRGFDAAGRLRFTVNGTGTLDDPHIEAHAAVTGLALSGEPLGNLEFAAHTANHSVTYELNTRVEAAELEMRGETALRGDYQTQARLEFSRFNIGALLRQAHIDGLNGESALAGSITLEGPLAQVDKLHAEARLQELAVTVCGVHLHSEGGAHAVLEAGRIRLDPLRITGEETDLHAQGDLALTGKKQLDFQAGGTINLKVAHTVDSDLTANGESTFEISAHGPLENPGLHGNVTFRDGAVMLEGLPNGLSQLNGRLELNQSRLEISSLTAVSGGGPLKVSGYLAYQNGLVGDLTATGSGIRVRYPEGVSSQADVNMHLQGTRNSMLLSGNILVTRFSLSPDFDIAAFANSSGSIQVAAPPDAPTNRIRLDVHVASSPQLNFQNAYAKLAGDVDLRLRGTVASPSLLGRVSITEGSAIIAGTRYELQRGEITFTNPVRIQPNIDLNATAHVEDYDITLGVHGTLQRRTITYRSDPPLPEADVVALLALGRTESQQRLYTQQQVQATSNATTDALLGGALNATVSSRVRKLFGAGSVKVDPNYLGTLGNSTSRIIVEEQLGPNVTLTYATDVNTTAQQLIQAEVAINRHVSVQVARDESGVFSLVIKATRRFR